MFPRSLLFFLNEFLYNRIPFTAGASAKHAKTGQDTIIKEASSLLDVDVNLLPGRVTELFTKWKKGKKLKKKGKEFPDNFMVFSSDEKSSGDIVAEMAEALRTQPEHIIKTIKRFKKELEGCLWRNILKNYIMDYSR